MDPKQGSFALENGLDLSKVVTTGSELHISEDFDNNVLNELENAQKNADFIGQPCNSFKDLTNLVPIDEDGYVKKKIVEEGSGFPLHDGNTVSVAFSGFWEGEMEPFDTRKLYQPLVVDLKDSGLLPGIEIAIRSMLVGEMSIFLLSYQVMYGEMGVPPRIKPKAYCVFYIQLLKSIITGTEGKINFAEPNMFYRVEHEVKILMSSGITLHKTNNVTAAIQLFRKAVFMLHKCRLANEEEENIQEKLLGKLYLNLANCYNKVKQPLKACTACNELKRIDKFWQNYRALFANAKALRMIGEFDVAEKRLNKAMHLCPNNKTMIEEYRLLEISKEVCNQNKLLIRNFSGPKSNIVKQEFKDEIDNLIKIFIENQDLCNLTMPSGLNSSELDYLEEACKKKNLFFNKVKQSHNVLATAEDNFSKTESKVDNLDFYSLGKYEPTPWDADIEALQDKDLDDHIQMNMT